MAQKLQPALLHLTDGETILGEIRDLPNLAHQFLIVHKPRQHTGTGLAILQDGVATIIIPWHQITLVQLLPSTGIEDVVGFVRE